MFGRGACGHPHKKKREKKKYKIKETPVLMTKACKMNIYPTETQSSLTA